MADIKYDINVDVQSKLGALISEIKKTSAEFDDMASKISTFAMGMGAALVGLGASAAKFSDEMADVAAANDTTIASVLGLASAMQGLGGNADNVGKFLQTLNNNIESAAGGNMKMASTLAKLGVGINELGSMSQEQIRDKLIKSIAAINDPVTRSAKAMEVFGKASMGMDFTKLASDIDTNTKKYEQYESSIKNAADAFDTMSSIIKDIKVAAAVAFEPLLKYIKDLKPGIDGLVLAIRLMAAALGLAVGASVLGGFVKLIALVNTLTVVSKKNPLIAIASVVLGIAGAMGVWSAATTDVQGAQEDLEKSTDKVSKKTQAVVRDTSGLTDAYKKQRDTLTQVTQNFDRQLQTIQDKLKLEGNALKLNEDQKKISEQIAAIETNKQNTLISLQQKYDALDSDGKARQKKAYEEQRGLIEKNAEVAKKSAEEQITSTQKLQAAFKDLNAASNNWYETSNSAFENATKQDISEIASLRERITMETKLAEITKIRGSLMSATATLSDEEKAKVIDVITVGTSQSNLLKKSYQEINDEISKYITIMGEQGIISKETAVKILSQTEKQRDAISQAAKVTASYNTMQMDHAREFSTGWNKSFNDYINNATNAASAAEGIFKKFSSGLEDYLVNATKNMKGSWKSFVSSMLEELLRSQIRQTMASLFNFGASKTGGQGGSFLGSLLGFANGGIIPTNNPVLVGERGPEILAGASGRTVIPNSSLGGSNVTYNIQAVDAMSFKQMVARDPGFIHAIAMQGGKSTPNRR